MQSTFYHARNFIFLCTYMQDSFHVSFGEKTEQRGEPLYKGVIYFIFNINIAVQYRWYWILYYVRCCSSQFNNRTLILQYIGTNVLYMLKYFRKQIVFQSRRVACHIPALPQKQQINKYLLQQNILCAMMCRKHVSYSLIVCAYKSITSSASNYIYWACIICPFFS